MRQHQVMQIGSLMMGSIAIIVSLTTPGWVASSDGTLIGNNQNRNMTVQLGPRPYFLVNDMDSGPLKDKMRSCENGPFKRSDFSIGHRGAALQFPEHTKESYEAAARMGAGILECDVTFTQDKELVCRHSQCDLHTTTNILETALAAKCSVPFEPAVYDSEGKADSILKCNT